MEQRDQSLRQPTTSQIARTLYEGSSNGCLGSIAQAKDLLGLREQGQGSL